MSLNAIATLARKLEARKAEKARIVQEKMEKARARAEERCSRESEEKQSARNQEIESAAFHAAYKWCDKADPTDVRAVARTANGYWKADIEGLLSHYGVMGGGLKSENERATYCYAFTRHVATIYNAARVSVAG